MELILNDEAIKKLDSLLGEIPAKFSLPIIQFLSVAIAQQNAKEMQKAVPTGSEPKGSKGKLKVAEKDA